MGLKTLVAVAGFVLLPAAVPLAHHSFSVAFDLSNKFTITGTLTKIDWRNPHIELFLDVKGGNGEVEAWVLESMPPTFFRSRKVTKADFENVLNKELTFQAVRARDGSRSGIALQVTFPDGKSLTLLDLPATAAPPAATRGRTS